MMSLLSAVALMAMIVRGLVPSGYMLAAADTPGDFVSIVICHGDGTDGTQSLLDLKNGKIVDPEDLIAARPDYVVILPWNLAAEIRAQLSELEASGTRFVVAIPETQIL